MTNSIEAAENLAHLASTDDVTSHTYHDLQVDEIRGQTEEEDYEEDEDESELHHLIGERPAARGLKKVRSKLAAGKISSSGLHGISNQQPHYSSTLDGHKAASGLFGRIFEYVGPNSSGGSARASRASSQLQSSTSGFVFYPEPPENAYIGEELHKRELANKPPPPPMYGHNNLQPKQKRSQQSTTNACLLLLIFLGLIFASTMFLVKLLSLIPPRPPSGLLVANSSQSDKQATLLEAQREKRWLIASPKCHIPQLDPWHKSIESYVRYKKPMDCKKVIEESRVKGLKKLAEKGEDSKLRSELQMQTQTLSFVRANKLYFTEKAVTEFGVFNETSCCFRPIERSQDNDDDLEPLPEQCQPILEQGLAVVNSTLIKVECSALNYTNVHVFIRHDDEEEEALKRVAEEKLNHESYYNVLMLGVDTISRLNGQRQLKQTLSLLRSQFKSLEFRGYNKVGENTFPNLIPLLTGLKPEQLTQTQCWLATNYTQDNDKGDDYLDNCKYLWNFYQQLGYLTYFSEDWPSASTFNYLKPGFKHEPTNYYGRPFTLAREPLIFPKFESIGCASCQLDTPIVEIDLNNLKNFLDGHKGQPYFAFHWINCPQHDDLNGASMVDGILKQFFKNIRNSTKLDRTFVIFFSDHGYRWNDFVSTRIGHYEASLPLLTIAAPEKFIKQHPDLYERLKLHQSALLTPFDLFKTLVAIRDLGAKHANSAHKLSKRQEINSTITTTTSTTQYPTATTSIKQILMEDGVSFKQDFGPLSLLDHHTAQQLDRSCIDAGIPDNYCVCHQFEPAKVDSLDVLGAAYYLVYAHLWSRIKKNQDICNLLDLEKVHSAELFDFEQMQSAKVVSKRMAQNLGNISTESAGDSTEQEIKTTTSIYQRNYRTTTSRPADSRVLSVSTEADTIERKHQYLPKREYNIMFSTKPGGGLFQEVVRFYGDDMNRCKLEVEKSEKVISDDWADFADKQATVMQMNRVCEFSVHSESLSRLNLYKDQSKCVKNNIELKKICYCK